MGQEARPLTESNLKCLCGLIVMGGFLAPPLQRGEGKSLLIRLTVTLSAPSPANAISCFYHPIQQSWDTLNCLVWMIVFLLFILNKINYFALSCWLVTFFHILI